MTEDWKYQIKLCSLPDIGSVSAARLIKHFGSARAALTATPDELSSVEKIGKKIISSIVSNRDSYDISGALHKMSQIGARYLRSSDAGFPKMLKGMADCPVGLYVLGGCDLNAPCISIVGCRNCTTYGQLAARKFSAAFARAGFTVVSGMARGIDSVAHFSALEAGGKTIAVLGCGVDVVYPPENAELYEKIRRNGAIISEFPIGSRAERQNFPIRNRLVSGLSLATVVIESDIRGGSMITARIAAEQGRDVFAVPGNIDRPQSRGCNALIRDGVTLAGSPEDVIDSIVFASKVEFEALNEKNLTAQADTRQDRSGNISGNSKPKINLSPDEAAVYGLLKGGDLSADRIAEELSMPVQKCSAALLMLEIKKLASKRGGTWSAHRTM